MNWSDLLAALALYLVLEGILPFLNPQAMKRLFASLAMQHERYLRLWGLMSMMAGLVLLYFVRG